MAERYGLEVLVPKARRRSRLPNATPTHVVNELLSLTVAEPTIGCRPPGRAGLRHLQDYRAEAAVGPPTGQAGPASGRGGRHRRTGLVPEVVAEEPFGRATSPPDRGDLVAVDGFYIGNVKGVPSRLRPRARPGTDRHGRGAGELGRGNGQAGRPTASSDLESSRHGATLRRIMSEVAEP